MEFYKLNTVDKYKSKQEIAYNEIRNAIIKCNLSPGDQLIIRSLASQLGVSESPIREALKRLITENFVVEQNSNLYVSPISAAEFLDMLEVRLELEQLAVRIATKRMSQEKIKFLTSILNNMKDYYKKNDMINYGFEHRKFHLESEKMCGVSYLVSALECAFDHHDRGANYFNLVMWEQEPCIEDHDEILKAMINGEVDNAERYLHKNKEKAFSLYKKHIREIIQKLEE